MQVSFKTSLAAHTISGRGGDMKKQISGLKRILTAVNEDTYGRMRLPLVEILGDRRVLIEQHRGVLEYGCHEIGVRVNFGILLITGNSLRLSRMTKDQLVICGSIDGVRFVKAGEGRCHV